MITLLCAASLGQTFNAAKPASSAPTPASPVTDPLGRSTPRGTITAFIRAVHRGEFVSASRYMQVTAKQKTNTEELARQLMQLIDRYFSQPLASVSDLPSGDVDDGLPLDRERVGTLAIGEEKADIILVRVNDPQAGEIWLISSDTLARVPALHGLIEKTWVERHMPEQFLHYEFLGLTLAQFVGWLVTIVVPLSFFWALSWLLGVLLRWASHHSGHRQLLQLWHARLHWPVILALTLIVHLIALGYLGFSLSFRIVYARCVLVLLVATSAWLLRRTLAISFERARYLMDRRGENSTESLILLGERVLNVIIVLAALFAMLTVVGVDTKTALTGVGIGGVAVALGAQKTVENLLGGIFLLSDKALAVGDFCCISSRMGTIEDITLRSVRLRTLEQTLLSIPAGILSQESIENFATRGKILAQTHLQLRHGTTAQQIRQVLDGIHQLLVDDPLVETETARIRLIDFGARAIELELFAYVRTSNNLEFLAARENLLLRIADVVESSGSGFAGPTQFVYLAEGEREEGHAQDARVRETLDGKDPNQTIVKLAG